MAGQRIDIMELRTLITLKRKGLSNRKAAALLNINRKTVDGYVSRFRELGLSWDELMELEEPDLRDLFTEEGQTEKERYEALSGEFSTIEAKMTTPGATLQQLWREYLQRHPDGYRYTQFTWHYRRWKGLGAHSGKLTHRAGEKLFVDFCGKKLYYTDKETGEQVAAEVFVAILPCSQYTFIMAVPSQKREDVIACLEACLRWLGGVPQAIVSDNLKSAVSKGSKYAPLINKTLADFALHYGCVVDPARPHRPQDKSLVERSVDLVYQRIYYPLSHHTFFDAKSINDAIGELLPAYNDYLFSHGNGSRRSHFLDLEREHLSPLPADAYSLRYFKRAKVQRTSHVYHSEDKNYYSVPHRYIGHHVEVQYNRDTVEICHNGQRIAKHARNYRGGHYTTVGEHMPSSHQVYSQWRPEYFLDRALRVGTHTRDYIERLIGQYSYPEIAYKQSQGILSFAAHYGRGRLENACRRALEYHRASYHTIEKILRNRLDMLEENMEEDQPIPEHANVRGAAHYS